MDKGSRMDKATQATRGPWAGDAATSRGSVSTYGRRLLVSEFSACSGLTVADVGPVECTEVNAHEWEGGRTAGLQAQPLL